MPRKQPLPRVVGLAPMGSSDDGKIVEFGFVDEAGITYSYRCRTSTLSRVISELQQLGQSAAEKRPHAPSEPASETHVSTVKHLEVGLSVDNDQIVLAIVFDSGLRTSLGLPPEFATRLAQDLLRAAEIQRTKPTSVQ